MLFALNWMVFRAIRLKKVIFSFVVKMHPYISVLDILALSKKVLHVTFFYDGGSEKVAANLKLKI
jgi:hypothetical protein